MNNTRSAILLLAALPLCQLACVGAPEDGDRVEEDEQEFVTYNALTTNALTTNALTTNALTTNALTTNALTTNALTTNALTMQALEDPAARELLKYVVGCALPSTAELQISIEGQTYTFDGEIGLAPEWGRPWGHCDNQCKQWVSGCVLSRVDYLGEITPISIRGKHKQLSSTPSERAEFPHREAAYYGDIFSHPQLLYACLSPGESTLPRVCGPSIDDCVVDVVGQCDDVCGSVRSDGSFPRCRSSDPDGDGWYDQGLGYLGSVTVFLHP
jgi:hypothetical protein